MHRQPLHREGGGALRDAGLLTGATLGVVLLTAGHPPLGSSTRYVESCREMVELGQWMVPHLGYVPYFEKPILTYWLGAGSQWLFGGGNLAAHLPSGLAALIAVLATWALGRRLRGAAFGLWAGLLLLGSAVFLGLSTTLVTDVPLAACLAVAWWAWWRWEEGRLNGVSIPAEPSAIKEPSAAKEPAVATEPSATVEAKAAAEPSAATAPAPSVPAPRNPAAWAIWAFWAALGLGVLAKGPIAVVLAGMAIAGYALLSGGPLGVPRMLWAMHPLRGTALLLLINLPWSLAVWQHDPRFLWFFYVRINFEALYDPTVNHPEPWWYYLPLLPGYLAPCTPVLLPALAIGLWRALAPAVSRVRGWLAWSAVVVPAEPAVRARLFLACVVLFPLLFLSLASSKLGTYLLPLLPAMVLLALDTLWPWRDRRWRWWAVAQGMVAVLLLAALVATVWLLPQARDAVAAGQDVVLSLGGPLAGYQWRVLDADTSGLATVDWGQAWLAQAALAALALGLAGGALLAWRGRLLASLAPPAAGLVLAAVVLLPRLGTVVPDLDAARLGVVARALVAADEPLIIQQELVHDYEIIRAYGRRLAITGRAREVGMGHFTEITSPDIPLPHDPYQVSGETLPQHPWLWSEERLRAAWGGPRRLWLLADRDHVERWNAAGLRCHVVLEVRHKCLLSDRP